MKNKNMLKVLSTSVVATMLTLSLGTGIGQAEENAQPLTETAQTAVSTENNTTTEATVVVSTEEGASTDETEQEEVSLLPGDLLYFFKTLTEKIKLALANEDVEKAMLLVHFTQDRLNEAEALFKEGKEDLAYSTLEKALELQELALNYSDEEKAEDTSEDAEKDEAADAEASQEI